MRRYRRSRTDYPKGVLAVYDNGGRTADRYTVVYAPFKDSQGRDSFPLTFLSADPFWPQGVCQHETRAFRPTGGWGSGQKVIAFADLPPDCQRAVQQDLEEMRAEA